jgi:8-oxo-dGTP pyrophosphatase MutT (NUDIX family)
LHLPGGGKKFNEKPVDTAIREIEEELSLNIENNSMLISDEVSVVKSKGILYRYFYVTADFKEKPKIKKNKEITEYTWVKQDSINIPKNIRPYL